MQTSNFFKTIVISAFALCISSCEKNPGPGGRTTVTGKVYAHDFDNTQRFEISKGYSSGERVYIIYGDNSNHGDDVRTSPDGSFEFKYLRKGRYKIYVNSLDTSIKWKGNKTVKPVYKEIEVSGKKEVVSVGDITINK